MLNTYRWKDYGFQKVLADLKADSTLDEAHSFDMSQLPFEEKKSLYSTDDRGRRIFNQRTKKALQGMPTMSLHMY